MKFPGAPYGLKMACGENPKRVYASRGPVHPHGQRRRLPRGVDRGRALPPALGQVDRRARRATRRRDLGLETLAEVLRGNILVHNHCYRADEMVQMVDIAEGVRLRDPLLPPRRGGVQDRRRARARGHLRPRSGPTGAASRWRRSTAIKANVALAPRRRRAHHRPLRRPVRIAAPQPGGGQVAWRRASPPGSPSREDDAIKWITVNPAWALGLDDRIGIARGRQERRRGALVRRPVQRLRARREGVDRRRDALRPRRSRATWRTDFELGFVPAGGGAR